MRSAETLHGELERLTQEIESEAAALRSHWQTRIERASFESGARNLAAYLCLRKRDLRPLQRDLMLLGLSSLGRLEGRVLPALKAVRGSLATLAGLGVQTRVAARDFFEGERQLSAHTDEIFGETVGHPIRLLVTAPSDAASDPEFARRLLDRGVDALRINCAHDDEAAWQSMIGHVRAAEAATGKRMRILMDLAGPKLRTVVNETEEASTAPARVNVGDVFALTRPGAAQSPAASVVIGCTLAAPLLSAQPGDRVFYDDGKLCAEVAGVEPWGLLLCVMSCPSGGVKLKAEKGLNFPDTEFHVSALTDKDKLDLRFVASHADGVSYSFVQSPEDVLALQRELALLNPEWHKLALILKIETTTAVRQLPELMAVAAARQPTAVMIARGDLAVEIGFSRTAEMQEEIMWLAEAAQVPVIWATQVLENFIQKGKHSRGEMTDAAMGARAECVMLNKGPHLLEAVDILRDLFGRMDTHMHKKTPQLRRLKSW